MSFAAPGPRMVAPWNGRGYVVIWWEDAARPEGMQAGNRGNAGNISVLEAKSLKIRPGAPTTTTNNNK